MREIYLDNAATTKLSKEAYEIMIKYMQNCYANPSSIHKKGREARKVIEECRKSIASIMGVSASEIVFTSGATEADNLAILGVCKACSEKKHIITTKIEHKAVLNTCKYLESIGYEITYLDVDEKGLLSLKSVQDAIRSDTVLISIMAVNNEIGTIMPINKIAKLAHSRNILFHTDAVSGFGKIHIDMENIDLMSISGHKIHGAKGVGILYVKNNIPFESCIYGGAQENGVRPGTENVAAIATMDIAIKQAILNLRKNLNTKIAQKRDYIYTRLVEEIDDIEINGDIHSRVANNLNISIKGVNGVVLVDQLSREGIYVSTGSACNSDIIKPSYVLKALNKKDDVALSSIRISLDDDITYEDLDYVVDKVGEIVEDIRIA